MPKLLKWLDNNILTILAGLLLVFIPLYPKWPLFDIIHGYNVRVRMEDFMIAATVLVFAVQLLRRKISLPRNFISYGLIAYLIISLLSVITAIFIIQTVPLEYLHAGKTFLHWLRRVEYLSLFFIFFVSIKSLKTVRIFVILFFLTLFSVIIYGYGQKYLYWPAFSTMNREFAKGWWLYLTEHARVLSTFGGHYDLAAYLVIALTLGWSFFFGLKNQLQKLAVGLLIAGGFWLLILTASRISFISYLVGLTVVVFLWVFKRGLGWGFSRWFVAVFLSLLVMLSFGDLSDRFLPLIRASERLSGLRSVLLKPATAPPKNNAVFFENSIAAVTSKSDQPPTPYPPRSYPPSSGGQSGVKVATQPADVAGQEVPLLIPQKTASGSTVLVPKTRTYSQNAILFDLSTGIRLDATWPRAISAFETDPFLGTGYATLTKSSKYEFTEAESTDNDYLRALGETGFLGAASYFGTILLLMYLAYKALGGLKDPFFYSLVAGLIGFSAGLLVNSLTIDIFESSKVAYVFWGLSGVTLATVNLMGDKIRENYKPLKITFSPRETLVKLKKFLVSDRFWVSLLLILAFGLRTYKLNTPLGDWHSWRQADTSAVTRNFLKSDQIDWLYPTFDDLSSVASGLPNPLGYRFVEFPIYNAATVLVKKIFPELSVEAAGRVTTDLSFTLAVLFLFLLLARTVSRRVAYLSAITYTLLPYTIYFGRAILPDTLMVTLSLGTLWAAVKYLDKEKILYLVLMTVLATAALLVKPYAIFLLLPLGYLWLEKYRFDFKKYLPLAIAVFIAALPLLWWRWWIGHFPEGVPASSWLFNGNGIRFKGAFWYWLFADRLGRLILGYWGLVLFGFGLVRKPEGKYRFFPFLFLLASLSYLVVFATGNVQHDYYQILIIPSLALIVGLGLDSMIFGNNLMTKLLAVISFLFMLAFGWYFVKDYFNINHPEIVAAGKKVEALSDWKALVVAPYDGDTAFLYQTNRKGWPIVERSINYLISQGADYYVSVRFDDLTNGLIKETNIGGKTPPKYKLLAMTDKYVIIQLVPDKFLPR